MCNRSNQNQIHALRLNKKLEFEECPQPAIQKLEEAYYFEGYYTDFADNLAKSIPDKNIDNFRTTCGTLKGLHQKMNYKSFLKDYDFRKLGKVRMDAILNFIYNQDEFQEYMDIILHSRNKESVLKKLKNKI